MIGRLLGVSLVSIVSFIVSSDSARAADRWPLSIAFGSPRLALHSLLAERPDGGQELAFEIARRLGLHPDQHTIFDVVQQGFMITPVLRHENNINGGIPADTINLGGFIFNVDPESRAKDSVAAGVRSVAAIAFRVAPGTILSFSGHHEFRSSLDTKFSVRETGGSVSLSYTSDNWAYVDAAVGKDRTIRELSDNKKTQMMITIGQIINGTHSTNDISVSYLKVRNKSVWQDRIRVDLANVNPKFGFFRFGLEAGERNDGALLPVFNITGSYSAEIFGAPTTLSMSFTAERGGDLLGVDREDNVVAVKLGRQLGKKLNGYVLVERRVSNIEAFNDTSIGAGISFDGVRSWN